MPECICFYVQYLDVFRPLAVIFQWSRPFFLIYFFTTPIFYGIAFKTRNILDPKPKEYTLQSYYLVFSLHYSDFNSFYSLRNSVEKYYLMKSNKNNIKNILPNHLNSDILCLQNLRRQACCTRQILTIHVFCFVHHHELFSVFNQIVLYLNSCRQ